MIDAFGVTHPGRVRAVNGDAVLADDALRLYLVADGMGRHHAGKVASRIAVETVQAFVDRSRHESECTWPYGIDSTLSLDANRLLTALKIADRKVFKATDERDDNTGLRTTVVAALAGDASICFGGVGDSRIYAHGAGTLDPLTEDDSWLSSISAADPTLTEHEKATHPMRHVLTKALGAISNDRRRRRGARRPCRRAVPPLQRRAVRSDRPIHDRRGSVEGAVGARSRGAARAGRAGRACLRQPHRARRPVSRMREPGRRPSGASLPEAVLAWTVESDPPGARILIAGGNYLGIDDQPMELTTPATLATLAFRGSFPDSVELRRTGYEAVEVAVPDGPGPTRAVAGMPDARPAGTVAVSGPYPFEVWSGGRRLSDAKTDHVLRLVAGPATLRLRSPDLFLDQGFRVQVTPG